MMRGNSNLNYLTNSVMLEEIGIPGINKLIIITVFIITVMFIIWTNLIQIEESISFNGYINNLNNEKAQYMFEISKDKLVSVKKGQKVRMKIKGIKDSISVNGDVIDILSINNSGVYMGSISGENNDLLKYNNESILVEVITGQKSLFKYLLSPIVKSVENSF